MLNTILVRKGPRSGNIRICGNKQYTVYKLVLITCAMRAGTCRNLIWYILYAVQKRAVSVYDYTSYGYFLGAYPG
jgi:hypothetical protein